MEDARVGFARRLRALMDASGLSVRGLEVASARTPRRRTGQRPIRLPRGTVGGMTSPSSPSLPEQHNFEVFVDTCLRVAAAAGRVLPDGLGEREAWDEAYRELREQTEERGPAAVRAPRPAEPPAPYRGLETFGPEDADYFFGRDALTAALLDRMTGTGGLLIVLGPSGSGKSSLLRAGLVSALTRDAATSPVVLTPGADPLRTLRGLAGAGHDVSTDELSEILRGRWAGRAVVVDQFEDVFTSARESARGRFIEVVTALATGSGAGGRAGPLEVVLGVRADYLGHCTRYPELVAAIERPVVVTPMTRDDLLRVIRGPARLAGLTLEEGLAELLLEDLYSDRDYADAVGVLPLLSHVLRQTWTHREGTRLTLAGYRASGGVIRSLAQTADATVNALDPASRRTARRLLTRLVHLGVDAADTARRMPLAELPDDPRVKEVLDRLAQARLVTVDAESARITHEALIRGWPRLRTWVEEDRADLVVLQRLEADATDWDHSGRDPAYLYAGNRLQAAREAYAAASWQHPADGSATPAFLAASENAAAEARRTVRRRRRLARGALVLMTALALAASAAGVLAVRAADRTETQRREILSRLLSARADVMRTADPVLSGLLSAAAWRHAHTDEATYGMLAALATPLRSVLNSSSTDVTAVAVGRTGMVATGGMDGTVRLWDATGRPKGPPLTGHHSGVYPVTFGPDDRVITSGDGDEEHDGIILVRDVATGRPLTTPLTGHKGQLTSMVFSRDGAELVTADDHQIVQRWDTRTWRRLGEPIGPFRHGSDVWTTLSPDGRAIAVQTDRFSNSSTWQVWDLAGRRSFGPPISARALAFSPDGRTMTTAYWNFNEEGSLVQRWRLTGRSKLGKPVRVGVSVYSTIYSPDGRTVAIGCGDGTVRFLDTRTLRQTGAVLRGHSTYIADLAYSPDGTRLVTTAYERSARIWDTTVWAQTPGPARSAEQSAFGAAISGDGRAVAVIEWTGRPGDIEPEVRPLDAVTGRPTGDRLGLGLRDQMYVPPNGMVLSHDGRLLVVHAIHVTDDERGVSTFAGDDGQLVIVDLATRRRKGAIDRYPDAISATAISADGSVIATVGERIVLLGTTTLRRIAASPVLSHPDDDHVVAAVFDSTGRLVITTETNGASTGSVIHMWRIGDWSQIGSISSPGSVVAMTVSSNGRYLATGDTDGTLRLWDLRTRREIAVAQPTGDAERPYGLAFGADGATVLAVAENGTITRWPIPLPADPYRAVCALAGRAMTSQEWNQFAPGEDPVATCA